MGYADDAKAYKLTEHATKNFFIECNVQFEEDQLHDPPQSEAEEGINTLSFPFDDDVLSNVSDSEDEEHDQHDIAIEIEPQEDLDRDPTLIPNQRPKWAQNIIEAVGNVAENQDEYRRRTSSQYQNEHVALSHIVLLP